MASRFLMLMGLYLMKLQVAVLIQSMGQFSVMDPQFLPYFGLSRRVVLSNLFGYLPFIPILLLEL